MSNEKEKKIEKTVKELEELGIKVVKLKDDKYGEYDVISTGSITLNIATGINGYPRGRIIEIFGPESGGKTTLSLIAIAQAQKAGGIAAFIDAEHSLNKKWAQKLGVNTDELYFYQPDYGEQALNVLEKLLLTKSFDIIVIDSVTALVPKAELEGNMEDANVGLHARLMSKAMRKLTGIASKSKTVVIFVNQIREKIGQMWGNPEITTGGRALKFYSSMRIRVQKVSKSSITDKNGNIIGHIVHAEVVKNKCACPYREAEFLLNFNTGIDNDSEIFDAALSKEIIKLNGKTYTFKKWQFIGKEKMKNAIKDINELKEELIKSLEFEAELKQKENRKEEDIL